MRRHEFADVDPVLCKSWHWWRGEALSEAKPPIANTKHPDTISTEKGPPCVRLGMGHH